MSRDSSGALHLRRSIYTSFYFSIALHAALILICFLFIRQQAGPRPRITYIEVTPPAAPKAAAPQAQDRNRRVVQTERGQITDQTQPNAFLGERTQTVDRQTVSKNQSIHMGATQTPAVSQSKSEKPTPSKPSPAHPIQAIQDLGALGLKMIPAPKPETDRPEWASSGGNAPSDYVKGIQEGDRTALNTQEFIFYGYYQRIRQRLDNAWVPILRQKLQARLRLGRHIASDSELTTRVIVVLNSQGEVTRVRVTTESGVTDLDDAAVGAFKLAGPFPNPPRGIADRDGQIQIPWEFILKS